jgi:hypothetical protein
MLYANLVLLRAQCFKFRVEDTKLEFEFVKILWVVCEAFERGRSAWMSVWNQYLELMLQVFELKIRMYIFNDGILCWVVPLEEGIFERNAP